MKSYLASSNASVTFEFMDYPGVVAVVKREDANALKPDVSLATY
ncbi:hypothetical protein [Candidatus Epulonipiscium viviparus]|nr:hypothetical protein [Candidatus Epulopiscium viviparus]